jgi:hypothetical protein
MMMMMMINHLDYSGNDQGKNISIIAAMIRTKTSRV